MIQPAESSARRTLDVSKLPTTAWDWHSPVWWGNTLLLLIESTTLLLMLASYFYIWRNFDQWPPPKTDVYPPIYDTRPGLTLATIDLVVILASCGLMYWTGVQARRLRRWAVVGGHAGLLAVSLLLCLLRFYEFRDVWFWWNDNAYASVVWTTLGLHLTYIVVGAIEFLIMGLWAALHPLDEHRALDVTLAAVYWYWVAGAWAVIYACVFLGPRVM